eukprot:TRINITY_DN51339_c0_g1_i1.p1 TRINITY_DN51339_c0_g1~~TRINITY_DN51339_c0_g1_i1.p1  ORF type:complete len:644 (-),score=152.20 TRINITY_DN51339_c0_g1_i1:13-1944(-)
MGAQASQDGPTTCYGFLRHRSGGSTPQAAALSAGADPQGPRLEEQPGQKLVVGLAEEEGRFKNKSKNEPLECNLSRFAENNHIFAPPPLRPLPVVVVTGFLGSGKTTLCQRLLSERDNLRVATVAHDLAANVNVDAGYIAASEKSLRTAEAAISDGSIVGLGGCACCDDFDKAFRGVVGTSVKEGVDEGRLDYLVVETSGAADPRRLINSLEQSFGPLTRARLDRVVAVVDAESVAGAGGGPANWLSGGKSSLSKDEVLVQLAQLSCADVVLLNKVDLLQDPGTRSAAEARLRQLAPHAKVLTCSYGRVALTELLEVSVVRSGNTAAVSHEVTPNSWTVAQDLEPRARPAKNGASTLGGSTGFGGSHGSRHRVVEWMDEEYPVSFARLQVFLSSRLPEWRNQLRRGKGVFWVCEDAMASWEWQLSGRLRYSCRRNADGFGGASHRSYVVLIFAPSFRNEEVALVLEALSWLTKPVQFFADATVSAKTRFFDKLKDFEMLEVPPLSLPSPQAQDRLLRFRLTGRHRFNISDKIDLTQAPYSVDVDAMNLELAGLVCATQGGHFLACGSGFDRLTGKTVVALLLPVDIDPTDSGEQQKASAPGSVPAPPPRTPSIFAGVLKAAQSEAEELLKRYFSHVTSCQCGQ